MDPATTSAEMGKGKWSAGEVLPDRLRRHWERRRLGGGVCEATSFWGDASGFLWQRWDGSRSLA